MEYKEDGDEGGRVPGRHNDDGYGEDGKRGDDSEGHEDRSSNEEFDSRGGNDGGDVAAKIRDSSPRVNGGDNVDDTKYKRAKGLSFDAEGEEKEEEEKEDAEEQAKAMQQVVEESRKSTQRNPSKSEQFVGEGGYQNDKDAKKTDAALALRRHIREM
jgi:hypothetical protein